MKIVKPLLLAILTVAWCYFLANRWVIGNSPVPALGNFLDPANGFYQNATQNPFPYKSDLRLTGLQDSVQVKYDLHGVPHIFANNLHDLFLAQGYIVAQHRLWQMEFQTHAAAGRISEIVGKTALDFDRHQRRKGMLYGAEKNNRHLMADSTVSDYVLAYAEGVNAYIRSLTYKDLPIEYKLLGYRPEEWTTLKTALILEYMIDQLTGYDEDLENTNARNWLGQEEFDRLFPEWLEGIRPVIPTGSDNGWDFDPVELPDSVNVAGQLTNYILPKPDKDNGSNNWAVSGSHTASGAPILCNDPHLGLNLPSLWIMMQLNAPGYNVFGFTFTGSPGITIGFNNYNAWGFTNGPHDNRDWYSIEFKDASREEYKYNDQWEPIRKRVETIKVRDGATFSDTILYTHHGPVVYDKNFGEEDPHKNYALRWIGHDISEVEKSLILLNQTRNYEDYVRAISYWDAPPQNIVFASVHGDIALWNQGNNPVKARGQGKFLMDGNDPSNDWQLYVPKSQSPFQHNPERGYVASANQNSVDSLYPYWVYAAQYEYYRNRLINNRLDTMRDITVEDMMWLQTNSRGLLPAENLPLLTAMVDTLNLNDRERQVVNSLKAWDYEYSVQLTDPIYFDLWWDSFRELLWDEFYHHDTPVPVPTSFFTTHFIKEMKDHPFVDWQPSEARESISDLAVMSLDSALDRHDRWAATNDDTDDWGHYKDTFIRHLADLNGSLAPFSRYHVMVNGEASVINSTKRNHGPSQRFIVEMTDPPQAWGIYPGGQSGNPGNPMYDNMIDFWRDGQYVQLLLLQHSEDHPEKIEFEQLLTPQP